MPEYMHSVGARTYRFADLKSLLARATPARTGDRLAGIAAQSAEERVAAQMALAELPLAEFLKETVVDYEADEITRLILEFAIGGLSYRTLRRRVFAEAPLLAGRLLWERLRTLMRPSAEAAGTA